MANSESHYLEVPVCQGTFFIPEKIEKSKKLFLIVAKPATVDCENRAIEGKEVRNLRATERRQALLELLCERRHETMENLAFEFGVSRYTIMRDVLELSISYPVYTVSGRHESGVFVEDDYYLGKQYLSDEQQKLLETMLGNCDENQKKTMLAIIKKFGRKDKK